MIRIKSDYLIQVMHTFLFLVVSTNPVQFYITLICCLVEFICIYDNYFVFVSPSS